MGFLLSKLSKNKKGSLIIVVILLVTLFGAALIFLVMTPVVAELISFARNQSAVQADVQATGLVNRIELVYYGVPVLIFIIVVIWALARAMRKDPYDVG